MLSVNSQIGSIQSHHKRNGGQPPIMSSVYHNKSVSKSKAKKRAYAAFSIYMRTFWTLKGFCLCFTCDKHLILKGLPGVRVTTGHWVEGHTEATYINETYVEPQCAKCNIFLGGNQGEFRDRIRKKLGNEVVDKLLIDAKKTLDLSPSDYLQKESYYKEKLKQLLTS